MPVVFKVEKGIPMPPREPKYPLRKMDVGDSFFMPNTLGINAPSCARIRAKQIRATIRGFRLRILKVAGGYRAWRIA